MRLYNLYLSEDKSLARRVRQMTGFVPARLAIFKLAFSHKSSQRNRDYAQTNNERLEYLGDAVLGTVVAEYLFKKYPNADEGFLTKMRSKIVKRKSLNAIGDAMGLDVLLAEYNRTRLSASMLGNAVEALVGAVYLEKGYRPTKRFIIQRMLKLYVDIHELETVDDNYKSQLLEHCQKNGKAISYKLVKKFKQDRRDRFKVAVLVAGKEVASADDFNKKAAEQLASKHALRKLGVEVGEAGAGAEQKAKVRPRPAAERRIRPTAPAPRAKARRRERTGEEAAASAVAATAAVGAGAKLVADSVREDAPGPAKQVTVASAPPRRQKRNNTPLGRSIWHATATTHAAVAVLDELDFAAPVVTRDSATAVKPVVAAKPPTKASKQRKAPRPIPLTKLKPMLADAGAAFDAVPPLSDPVVDEATREEIAWLDTPLELDVSVPAVAVEILDDWEDTLLELAPTAEAPAAHSPAKRRRGGRRRADSTRA